MSPRRLAPPARRRSRDATVRARLAAALVEGERLRLRDMAGAKRLLDDVVRVAAMRGFPEELARGRLLLSRVISMRLHHDEALGLAREALAWFRDAGDRDGECAALNQIGYVFSRAGRHEESIRFYRAALARGPAPRERVMALRTVAVNLLSLTRYAEAREWLARAEEATAALGDPVERATLEGVYGGLALREGRLAEAERRMRAAIAGFAKGGHLAPMVIPLSNLGAVLERRGRRRECRACVIRSHALARRTGFRIMEISGLQNLAEFDLEDGRLARAGARLKEALRLARGGGERRYEIATRTELAKLAERRGRRAEALRQWRAALALARAAGRLDDVAEIGARLAACAPSAAGRRAARP